MSKVVKCLRTIVKGFIYDWPFVQRLFILGYRHLGKRPFSFGYAQYKFSFVKDIIDEHLEYFKNQTLVFGYGCGLDERAVEYPWAINGIRVEDRRILDAGSSLNHPAILSLPIWRDKEISILTLDFEGRYKGVVQPKYFYGDLRKTSFQDNHFDLIISISTFEHIGMDNTFLYTENNDKKENRAEDYLLAIDEMKRILKPGGKLLITVPFGVHKNHGWFQVFDKPMVENIKTRFQPAAYEEIFFKYQNRQWNFSNAELCKDSIFYDVHENKDFSSSAPAASESVACLELVK